VDVDVDVIVDVVVDCRLCREASYESMRELVNVHVHGMRRASS